MRYFSNIITLSVVRNYLYVPLKRNFLSSAFDCNDSWNKRLSDPLLSKADPESLYYELMNVYNRTKKLNPIDIDIFVNIQTNDSFLTEVEELVHKLRLTAETGNTLPTTHHGFIRLFSHYNVENLMRILNDRLNYGIFPDYYCSIYLLNKFLKENDFTNAAKVAALRMIQEDFSNNLLKYMSLYGVLRYLNTKEPWENSTSTDTESADNEDEEVKVKVKFLRNPFWDDHFDLTDGQQICGKTLLLISLTMENEMKNSLKIMGLALFNKWDMLEEELMKLLENQKEVSTPLIYKDSLKFTEDVVTSKLEDPSKLNNIINYLKAIDPQHCIDEKLIECVEKNLKEEIRVSENVIIQLQEEVSIRSYLEIFNNISKFEICMDKFSASIFRNVLHNRNCLAVNPHYLLKNL